MLAPQPKNRASSLAYSEKTEVADERLLVKGPSGDPENTTYYVQAKGKSGRGCPRGLVLGKQSQRV